MYSAHIHLTDLESYVQSRDRRIPNVAEAAKIAFGVLGMRGRHIIRIVDHEDEFRSYEVELDGTEVFGVKSL